jgi:holo-[acyl-carrier protein] synthase
MIIKTGIDIVNINRIARVYDYYGDKFLNKVYTEEEIEYCLSKKHMQVNSFAKRFAGKEAFVKAIGEGFKNISFQDIEILNDSKGAPFLQLEQPLYDYIQNKYKIETLKISISLSDDTDYAVASVVILGLK